MTQENGHPVELENAPPTRATSEGHGGEPVIRLKNMSKTFGAVRALDNVSLDIVPGEIRGLVGRNGSGKSTLIKILAGYHAPEEGGSLEVKGRAVKLPLRFGEARRLGLSFMHQDLGLISEFSVLENVRAGRFETGRGWRIRWHGERRRVREAMESFGLDVFPEATVGSLREVERALVAIVRSFMDLSESGGGVLVLDEPTASLPRDDVERLFVAIRHLVAAGSSVIFVSHRLDEVTSITDRVSVLRDGRLIGTVDTRDANEGTLIELILGRKIDEYYPETLHAEGSTVVLDVKGLSGEVARGISFELHSGEIIGITGLRGMGHEEVPYLIFGARRATGGMLRVGGRSIRAEEVTPRKALGLGMIFLPGDRQRLGGVGEFTVQDNVSLPVLRRFFRGGRLRHKAERAEVAKVLTSYDVRPAGPKLRLGQLSGGNQQKALLAKWLQCEPTIHLFHEPTLGVDVGAKREVFARLDGVAARGGAVLIASEEWEDLAHICDRVFVCRDGVMSGAGLAGDDLTEERLIEQCYRTVPGGRRVENGLS